ncbi:unnamed protein product [Dicrocoelium dendriticum]|nr:unnamed protein product [Dicrocoelium dendriticum]
MGAAYVYNIRVSFRLIRRVTSERIPINGTTPEITHRLLNPNSEPLRYDGQIGCHTVHRSVHTAFSELRTIFWDMLDSGAPPSRTLLLYFNTPIAMMPSFFSICLLDMATAWALYGYP